MENSHAIVYAGAAAGGGAALYLLWEIRAELRRLNRHLRKGSEPETPRSSRSSASASSSSGSRGVRRSSGSRPTGSE